MSEHQGNGDSGRLFVGDGAARRVSLRPGDRTPETPFRQVQYRMSEGYKALDRSMHMHHIVPETSPLHIRSAFNDEAIDNASSASAITSSSEKAQKRRWNVHITPITNASLREVMNQTHMVVDSRSCFRLTYIAMPQTYKLA